MFNVGDTVDVSVECSYPDGIGGSRIINVIYRGIVSRLLPENRASVHFKVRRMPVKPGVCDRCGFSETLSRDCVTGEIFCMAECGYRHGFEEWDSTFPLEKLVNITAKMRGEKKTKFNARLADLLREGVNESLISPLTMDKILKLVGSLPS